MMMSMIDKSKYEQNIRDLYSSSDDDVLSNLTLSQSLSLEIESIKYEMVNRTDDFDHWVKRFEDYVAYVS